jgi:beta-galactosidase
MKKQIIFLVIIIIIIMMPIQGQEKIYNLDLQSAYKQIKVGHLDFTGKSPDGTKLGVNSAYFEKNGKPWFPIMGEFHYIRFPEKYWEEEILKMKNGGIRIIATYVFWNAHENPKGSWNWSGIRDLRRFVELCAKHDMYVWLRVGPWSHGEQLHGGHPDWIDSMKGKRSNDPEYLAASQKLFNQIGQQTKGLYFKEGGPIIGAQLENEFASGDDKHIGELKRMAISANIKPVYFTITANTVFNDSQHEAIPLQGAYPYRGWEKGGGKATKDFLFGNDQWILSESLGKVYYDVSQYPKGLCEQGAGSQVTYQNRFIVEPNVVEAHLQNQLGRGMNMIGYYMFQGGTQLPGLKEPGCPESYDFQAPLGEFGELRPSYKYLKILHNFIRDFGSDLAKSDVVEPENPVRDENNTDKLRYVARVYGNGGFLFLGNTQVRVPMPDKRFQMKLNMKGETIQFPRKEILLKGETTAIFLLI